MQVHFTLPQTVERLKIGHQTLHSLSFWWQLLIRFSYQSTEALICKFDELHIREVDLLNLAFLFLSGDQPWDSRVLDAGRNTNVSRVFCVADRREGTVLHEDQLRHWVWPSVRGEGRRSGRLGGPAWLLELHWTTQEPRPPPRQQTRRFQVSETLYSTAKKLRKKERILIHHVIPSYSLISKYIHN